MIRWNGQQDPTIMYVYDIKIMVWRYSHVWFLPYVPVHPTYIYPMTSISLLCWFKAAYHGIKGHQFSLGSSAVFILNSAPTQLKTQLSWVIPWVGVLFCILSWVGNVTQLVGSVGGPSQVPWQHALSTAQLPWKRHVTADDTVQNGGVPGGWQFLRYAAIGRLFLTTQEAKVG